MRTKYRSSTSFSILLAPEVHTRQGLLLFFDNYCRVESIIVIVSNSRKICGLLVLKPKCKFRKMACQNLFFLGLLGCHVFYLDLDLDSLSIKPNTDNNKQELCLLLVS